MARESWQRDRRPGALVVAFGMALLAFLSLVAAVLLYRPFVALDMRVSAAIRGVDSPAVEAFMRAMTRVGDGEVVAALTLALAVTLLIKKRPAQAILVAVTVGAGSLLGEILRISVGRLRPGIEYARIPIPETFSMPSGHALATFLLAGMVFFVVAMEARSVSTRFWVLVGCVTIATIVAISRVYLGVHWLGDVMASWALGTAWMTFCAGVYFALTSGDKPT